MRTPAPRAYVVDIMTIQRVLFVSGAANLGGVQSSTRARIRALDACGVVAHKLFLKPGAGIATYVDVPTYITDEPRDLDRIVRTGKYDVISMINRVDLLPSLRRVGFRGRVLLEVRGEARHALKACKKLSPLDVGGIIVISRYVRSLVKKALPTDAIPIHVVYNAVDTSLFRPLPPEEGAPLYGLDVSQRPIVMWVGRLSINKNYPELLRIASLLTRYMKPAPMFWVVSDTNAKDNTKQFRKLVRQMGLGPHVRLFPCVPHTMMVHLYNAVARSGGCVLSTSVSEGFQNSLLEAMACGVPVVTSAVGGNVELVRDGVNGRLYPLGQPLQAARCIRQLLRNETLRRSYAAAGLEWVRTYHSPERHARELLAVLEQTPVRTYGGAGAASVAVRRSGPGKLSVRRQKPVVKTAAPTRRTPVRKGGRRK